MGKVATAATRVGRQTSRRRFLRIFAVAGGGGLVWGLRSWWQRTDRATSMVRQLMGTVVHLTVAGDRTAGQAAASACLDRMSALAAVLSRHRADSQVSQLNREARLEQADPALSELVRRSTELSETTGGAFDISVEPVLRLYRVAREQGRLPEKAAIAEACRRVGWRHIHCHDSRIWFAMPGMAITLDGIAKGYVVDAGVEVLRDHGFGNVLVEAGGDLRAAGSRADGLPWRLAIAPPRPEAADDVLRFTVDNRAVATSGDVMHPFSEDFRYHHIIDPRSGISAAEPASATVIAPNVTLADALATTLMVLAPETGLQLVEGLAGCQACVVTKNMEALRTTGFPA